MWFTWGALPRPSVNPGTAMKNPGTQRVLTKLIRLAPDAMLTAIHLFCRNRKETTPYSSVASKKRNRTKVSE